MLCVCRVNCFLECGEECATLPTPPFSNTALKHSLCRKRRTLNGSLRSFSVTPSRHCSHDDIVADSFLVQRLPSPLRCRVRDISPNSCCVDPATLVWCQLRSPLVPQKGRPTVAIWNLPSTLPAGRVAAASSLCRCPRLAMRFLHTSSCKTFTRQGHAPPRCLDSAVMKYCMRGFTVVHSRETHTVKLGRRSPVCEMHVYKKTFPEPRNSVSQRHQRHEPNVQVSTAYWQSNYHDVRHRLSSSMNISKTFGQLSFGHNAARFVHTVHAKRINTALLFLLTVHQLDVYLF